MNQQSFVIPFFTIGEFHNLSGDDVTRSAHIDVPADCLHVAASLQSARQWLNEQHAGIDMECTAELPLRAYFSFKSEQLSEGFHVDSAQLIAMDEGFVVRASLDNGVCVESDWMALAL